MGGTTGRRSGWIGGMAGPAERVRLAAVRPGALRAGGLASLVLLVAMGCSEARQSGNQDVAVVPDVAGETHDAEAFDGTGDLPFLKYCSQCHGSEESPAPPVDTQGKSDPARRGVGAHRDHLSGGVLADPIPCSACHVVPLDQNDAGHMDHPLPATVTFQGLAVADGAAPTVDAGGEKTYSPTTKLACRNVYCHGATLAGGKLTQPVWNLPGQSVTSCDSCHGFPPPAPHPAMTKCGLCHPTATEDGQMKDRKLHVNGKVDVALPQACSACHGKDATGAPPPDLAGNSEASAPGVGAHTPHLGATDHLSGAVACSTCHVVPATVEAATHIDNDHATVTLTGLATAGGAAATYDDTAKACTNVYCHGATLKGGKITSPTWTSTDNAAIRCDSCHGDPPPAPHVQGQPCFHCHSKTAGGGIGEIAFPENHINGKVDVDLAAGCASCHGSPDNAAPPVGVSGETATTTRAVGAHQAHLKGPGNLSAPVDCVACHDVPTQVEYPGHINGTPDVAFHGLAMVDGASPEWDRTGNACSDVYCHGATITGGKNTAPVWTNVDGTQEHCDSCHGDPPPPPHAQSTQCGMCHAATATLDGQLKDKTKHVNGQIDVGAQACNSCHGSAANDAPPKDTQGQSGTTVMTVGAHQSHVTGPDGLAIPVPCEECHIKPKTVGDAGHLDGVPGGDVKFGALATADGAQPAWDATTAKCSQTYCHGATMGGGTNKLPVWTKVDGTQAKCGTCHGNPPPSPHPDSTACATCHNETIGSDGLIADKTKHIDGKVQVAGMQCNSCHGSAANDAPPKDTQGRSDTAIVTVGAHQTHLLGTAGLAGPVACAACHVVPGAVTAPGHLDGAPNGDVTFGLLAKTDGLQPAFDGIAAKCANVYCHGASLTGGSVTIPLWTMVDGSQDACGTCHGNPPPPPHPNSAACGLCHTATATLDGKIKDVSKHVDGLLQVASMQCNSCHGNAANAAPPKDVNGGTATTLKTVGAHQSHVSPTDGLASALVCGDCHVLPKSVDAPGHLDGAQGGDVTFGSLALDDGAVPAWDPTTAKCAGTYCHGATLAGGTNKTPLWTKVDGSQDACGTCHGNPPPLPHPQVPKCGMCHTETATHDGKIKDPSKHIDGTVEIATLACNTCHGGTVNNAPPKDVDGNSATTLKTVGAHQSHLNPTDGLTAPVACQQCHDVPPDVYAPGHLDGTPGGDVTFGALAQAGGAKPQFDGAAAQCSGAYCHGATLKGGKDTTPVWTIVDGSQKACGNCHGNPPPAPHAQSTKCGLCHTETTTLDGKIKDPTKHIDGQVQVAPMNCNSCHGGAANNAPPKDVDGNTDPSLATVGAHQSHLVPTNGLSAPVACNQCHVVPSGVNAAGHLDGTPGGDVTFGALATADATNPTWDAASATCTGAYCHGASLAGGTNKTPLWTRVDGTQDACGSCHGNPPPAPHAQSAQCGICHAETCNTDGTIKDPTKHIDGQLQVLPQGCNQCHGSDANPAPPKDTNGATSTSLLTVGAHQTHVNPASGNFGPMSCTDCHTVPNSVDQAGHMDGTPGGDVSFGALANADGTKPAWAVATGKCAGVYCHGATLSGGTLTTPIWNKVDGTQAACGTCHGNPPPAPHAQSAKCGLCHTQDANLDGTIKNPALHMNGQVEVITQSCNSCHGSAKNDAPPVDVNGGTATTLITVGAHQSHIAPADGLTQPVACQQCHVVPGAVDAAGHLDGTPGGDITFGALASAGGALPKFNATNAKCSGAYCHGATLTGGVMTTPQWTLVDGSQKACGNCHGNPPPAPHPQSALCGYCHTQTAGVDGKVKDASKHVDGMVQVINQACNACHGSGNDYAPPVDTHGASATTLVTVGAHQSHLKPANGLAAPIACTECHVVPATVDAPGHLGSDGIAEVAFGTLAKTGGLTPKWDRTTTKACSSTYCHGAGMTAGGTVTTPVWTVVDGAQMRCDSCHGNPPPAPHPAAANCGFCHDVTANVDGTIKDPTKHVDGTVQVVAQACNSCHGNAAGVATNPPDQAPPVDTHGASATSLVTVGAHRSHLAPKDGLAAPVACNQCHVVPGKVDAPGHLAANGIAEVTFGTLATADSATPTWDRTKATCAGSYCHGATLGDGTLTTPIWTQLDGSQDQCGTCHGIPPKANNHPQSPFCGFCHSQTTNLDGSIKDPTKHMDGAVEVSGQTCHSCHGSAANAAPPVDSHAQSDPTLVTVGAHQAHLLGTGNLSGPIACGECHTVPATVDAPGHLDLGGLTTVTFGTLSKTGGLSPAWNRTTARCQSTWCHGATLSGGATTTPLWTLQDGSQELCTSCHGNPPPWPHPVATQTQCATCHADTISPNGLFKDKTRHVNGVVDLSPMTCNDCHGDAAGDPAVAANQAPPRDTQGLVATTAMTVGAHQAHLNPANGLAAPRACGDCHVVPTSWDQPGHMDGVAGGDVSFGTLAKTGSLTPAFSAVTGKCANTYCHGTQLVGGITTTPTWNLVDGSQDKCSSCHGNPPSAPHPQSALCGYCHTQTANADGTIKDPTKHVDGTVEVVAQACNTCHGNAAGSASNPPDQAPPVDTHGVSATTSVTVGAHQSHLKGTANYAAPGFLGHGTGVIAPEEDQGDGICGKGRAKRGPELWAGVPGGRP